MYEILFFSLGVLLRLVLPVAILVVLGDRVSARFA